MLGRWRRRTPDRNEDPAVAEIEQILARATPATTYERRNWTRRSAAHALWICACITIDDSPIWLIFDTPDCELVWLRVPDGVEALDLVSARSSAGGHSDPAEVLAWLQGQQSLPWGPVGSGVADPGVTDHLLAVIRRKPATESS